MGKDEQFINLAHWSGEFYHKNSVLAFQIAECQYSAKLPGLCHNPLTNSYHAYKILWFLIEYDRHY